MAVGVKVLLVIVLLMQAALTIEVGRQCFAIWRLEDTLRLAGDGQVGGVYYGSMWEPILKPGRKP